MAQQLMELEVAQHLGAEKYKRAANRTGERNGYRDRSWDTRVGSIELPRRLAVIDQLKINLEFTRPNAQHRCEVTERRAD